MSYVAPVRRLKFAAQTLGAPVSTNAEVLGDDDLEDILRQASRFAEERIAPLDQIGDRHGAAFSDGQVTTPPGFVDVFTDWTASGWNGVTLPAEWSGMGLSTATGIATMEMWTSACMAYGVGVLLIHGAVELLMDHATDELKQQYLPSIVGGQWYATMALTEPQAGSDLGALRTKAVPQDDGSYRLFGNKIFITFGEHDLTENIVHLVLARIEGAPEGTAGISLFLVPKILPNEDGSLGQRNDVICTGIEHKMGLHASPTCSLTFGDKDGAKGWLVGKPNQGLAAMFVMMNRARLGTGMQGVAIAERATQRAEAFADTRIQGRVPTGERNLPIRHHPDVQRMLKTMRALTSAGRSLGYGAASAIETAATGASESDKATAQARTALLTPLVKAYCSEIGVEVASLGMQIHGGMGYVEETGAAQHFRDARITPIYEGTNGIQAIDLTLRKVRKDQGKTAQGEIDRYSAIADKAAGTAGLETAARVLKQSLQALGSATAFVVSPDASDVALLSAATSYLRLFAQTAAGALLIQQAIMASEQLANDDPLKLALIEEADFFARNVMAHAPVLAAIVRDEVGVA
ncbi:acyl-CoA dehydrogenase [uncultured Brevundimonas sp.]|uniref:acyl-CoA dehydrogenase n=1 Tax=uncultured Brevundimonas sp. TaxID=213418 RepID=UPI002639D408|nr:acyl-CoA dehydrogenase [uncultured Brevundimonas sp.]